MKFAKFIDLIIWCSLLLSAQGTVDSQLLKERIDAMLDSKSSVHESLPLTFEHARMSEVVKNESGVLTCYVKTRYWFEGVAETNIFSRVDEWALVDAEDQFFVLQGSKCFWHRGYDQHIDGKNFLVIGSETSSHRLLSTLLNCEIWRNLFIEQGLEFSGKQVIFLASSEEDFIGFAGLSSKGAAGAMTCLKNEGIPTQQAVYLNEVTWEKPNNPHRIEVIGHELVHLAMSARTSSKTPWWLREGLAVFLSDQHRHEPLSQDQVAITSLRHLSTKTEVSAQAHLWDQSMKDRYKYAGETVGYLAETYGIESVLSFYEFFQDDFFQEATKNYQPYEQAALLSYAQFGVPIEELEGSVKSAIQR